MLSRVAEELFLMSRDVERAATVTRLSEVTWHLELDAGTGVDGAEELWLPLLAFASDQGHGLLDTRPRPLPREVRSYLSFDPRNHHALLACVHRARAAAQGVRESISSEMWEQLNRLHLSLVQPDVADEAEQDATGFYRRVRDGLQFFQGLADATIAHDEAWHFVCLGKFLERADNVTQVLDLQAHLLAAGVGGQGEDSVRWLAVLRSCGAAEAYARHYSLRVEPARVVEFVLLNPRFPQAVRFSVAAARDALDGIASGNESGGPVVRAMGRLCSRLDNVAVDEVLEEGLDRYLKDVRSQIAGIGDQVTLRYLREEWRPDPREGAARAALIMAAQQQQ